MLLEESPISAWRNTGIALHSKHQGVHRRPQGMTMLSPLSEGTSSPLGRRALNFQLPCYCLSLRNSCLTLFFFFPHSFFESAKRRTSSCVEVNVSVIWTYVDLYGGVCMYVCTRAHVSTI